MRTLPTISLLSLSLLAADASAAATKPATDGSNDFTLAMYGRLAKQDGNVFFSGTSLREALGIAYLGAQGDTAREMAGTLHFDADTSTSVQAAKTELADWETARGSAQLDIANRLWLDKSFEPTKAFASAARLGYGATTDPIDFMSAPDASRTTINEWVAGKTHDHIKDLLPAKSIDKDTRVVITNAIWFKGDWASAFAKDATHDEPFAVPGANTRPTVATMHQTGTFGFSHVSGVKTLEMKYEKSDLAMDVLLPDDPNGLSKLEDDLSSAKFATFMRLLPHDVQVSLPKIKLSWGAKMNDPLRDLGMRTAFIDGLGDFSGIAPPEETGGKLYVSAVFQKAFVAIDEKGTEATAATGVVMGRETVTSVAVPPEVFKADHPYLFVIRDVRHGRILFMGRVQDPRG
jgi:serpin B